MEKIEKEIMANGVHQASCLSCLNILETLYYRFLKKGDRFILSKAHASAALYFILADKGILDRVQILSLDNHCTYGTPGIEFSGGSLGMGLGVACGMALSLKNSRKLPLVVCLVGDGELYEGSNWEAIMFASAKKLNNLICIVDRNYMSASDFTEDSLPLEPLDDKFNAFGWDAVTIDDTQQDELLLYLRGVRFHASKNPKCLIVNTIKGRGYDKFEGNPLNHTMKI